MLNRTIAPDFTRSTDFELIQPNTFTLSNGAKAFVVTGGNQPVIRVEILLKAGRWYEKTWGASYFASQLLSKGTSKKSSYEIASIFDQYGAHLEVSPGLDIVSVSLYSLVKNLEPTLALVRELLSDSIFPEKEIIQLKSVYLQNLKINLEKTSFQASKLFRKSLFGAEHPYGKELEAAEAEQLTRDQIIEHHTTFSKDFTVIVSGDVSEASKKLVEDTLSDLALVRVADKDNAFGTPAFTKQHVSKEGSVQSSIRMGKKAVARLHPDYALTLFLNHIFGGYFGSRLMRNIREEKGLTYGIYSSLHTLQYDNYLVIGADVNNENITVAVDEIRLELKRLRNEPLDATELEVARNHFIGSLQAEITTPFAHADKIKNMHVFNLPSDFYQRMIQTIDRATAEDLMAVASKYFLEDDFLEIAVG
jgi:predicted Zn-dependent peptidase